MVQKHKVKIWNTSTCPYCDLAKDFLKSHDIAFEEIDVSKNPKAAQEMIRRSGQMGVPVIDIDGELVIGFDKEKLKKLLEIRE